MEAETCSPIKNISRIKYKEREFEWWGPSPDEARKIQLSKPKELRDKRTTLKEAVTNLIKDGQNLALGGFVNIRIPVAIVHEIIRQGAKDLTLSFQSQSFAADLLFGAMVLDPDRISIKRVEMAYVAYENVGLASLFRYLAENGMIEIDDYTNYGMAARFKAGAMGIPFLPVRDHGGSDMELVNRGKMIKCPFSGKNTYLVPACHPDVGLIHAQVADEYGNCRLFGPLCTDPEIALASTYTIVTAEKIIPSADMRRYPNLTEIPYVAVDAVVNQSYGGHPGLVYGSYWFEEKHRTMFRNIAEEFRVTGKKDKLKEYYDKYIFSCETFDDYIGKLPQQDIRKAADLDGGQPIIL
ncbi:MAG: CoA transferase [Chloroflexota bacterium]|nr:CoA transferase [Chloroflexota bacterium]